MVTSTMMNVGTIPLALLIAHGLRCLTSGLQSLELVKHSKVRSLTLTFIVAPSHFRVVAESG
jgi:hypothetical protein